MKKTLWFKAKYYGWGWYPSTWQGWLVLIIFLAVQLWNTGRFESNYISHLAYTLETIGLISVLIYICYLKGEKPGWRWGQPKLSPTKSKRKNKNH